MHAPKEHADSIFRCFAETRLVPENHFPIKCPAFYAERGVKKTAIRTVTGIHEELKVVYEAVRLVIIENCIFYLQY